LKPELLQGFYLGDRLVLPLRRQVTGDGETETLSPEAVEVLLQLASAPSSLVSREALQEKVWGAAADAPQELDRAIDDILRALRDSADDPRYIQTLPRRGYRLIVAPRLAGAAPDGGVAEELGLLDNLRQRGVLETAVTYLVLGWLVIQIADVIFDQLLLPRWAGTFVTVLVIAGFPIALILAWFLEFRDGRAVLDTGPESRNPRRRTHLTIVGALGIAAVLVFAYDRLVGLPQEAVTVSEAPPLEAAILPVDPNSIAVLRFLNLDGSEQTEIFASGFAEEMIVRLSRLPTVSVAARGDAWSLGAAASSGDVRRRLRVAYYVEGSVRMAGDSLGVNVRLIDSNTGFQIASRNFDEPVQNFNELQKELINVAVANLRIALPPETRAMLNSLSEDADLDAYILYRKGREVYDQPSTSENLTAAIAYYRQALELDPAYAAAHAGLCDAYIELYYFSGAASDIEIAEDACNSALASNPRLHMVHAAFGDLYFRTGRVAEAEAAFEKALEINPQDVQAMRGLADVYQRDGKYEQAEDLLTAAIAAQPGNWRAINNYGSFLFSLGRYADAAAAFREVVFLDPENFQAKSNLGSALTMAGEFQMGRQVLEDSLAIRPQPRTYSNLGVIYYYLGEFEKSVDMHRRAVDMRPGQATIWLNLADAMHFAGRDEEAAAAFETARELSLNALSVDATDSEELGNLAWSKFMLGERDEASDIVDRAVANDPGDPYGYYYSALIRVQTGDTESALKLLRTALEKGYPPGLLVAEPYLGELRANDRFHAIIVESFQ